MFDRRKNLSDKAVDTADLIIDFATLGEYGLEPVAPSAQPCEGRRRPANRRSTGAWASAINRFATQSP